MKGELTLMLLQANDAAWKGCERILVSFAYASRERAEKNVSLTTHDDDVTPDAVAYRGVVELGCGFFYEQRRERRYCREWELIIHSKNNLNNNLMQDP